LEPQPLLVCGDNYGRHSIESKNVINICLEIKGCLIKLEKTKTKETRKTCAKTYHVFCFFNLNNIVKSFETTDFLKEFDF